MPTLAVGGEKSFGEATYNSLRRVAKDTRSVVIPDAGHWVAEEQPEAFTRALLAFLQVHP